MPATLSLADYLIWGTMLILSLLIGCIFGWKENKNTNGEHGSDTKEFLLGSRNINFFLISCSMVATFISTITLLGIPSEMYQNGIMCWFMGLGFFWSVLLCTFVFMPMFYNLDITSSYQYLGLRFSKANQIMGAITFICQMVPYLGLVLYAPSVALEMLINKNIWIPIVSMGTICTLYTFIGGMRAIVWTDSLQLGIVFIGLLVVVVKGYIQAEGFGNIWKVANKAERLTLDFSIDPRHRNSFWSITIGGGFMFMSMYGINQIMVQRVLSIKTLRSAHWAYVLNILIMNIFTFTLVLCGFVVIYEFYGCDPISTSITKPMKADQILPLYVSLELIQYPCVAGIFVAGIFSGALSSLSSGLNALAAVSFHDIILLYFIRVPDRVGTITCKALVVIYGLITLLFAYLTSLTSKMFQIAIFLFGVCNGPVLGVFIMGMFIPFANCYGAISGHLTGQFFLFFLGAGFYIFKIRPATLPIFNFNCTGETIMSEIIPANSTSADGQPLSGIANLFAISYMWYSFIGVAISLSVGLPISWFTRHRFKTPVRSIYISPIMKKLLKKYLDTYEDEYYASKPTEIVTREKKKKLNINLSANSTQTANTQVSKSSTNKRKKIKTEL